MKFILVILFACACCAVVIADQFSFDSRLGVVDANSEGRLCLSISDPSLVDGTAVSLILPDKPQRVVKATVEGKAAHDCSRNPSADSNASFYWLKIAVKKLAVDSEGPLPPVIAVVRPVKAVSVRRGIASGDLNGDGRAEFFRVCTSTEGNHLTVWTGEPLIGKRVWHSYYYLGYDVVPTCKKKDYQ